MRQAQGTILESLSILRRLCSYDYGITQEPLPRRWVELIRHLDERERRRSQAKRPEPQPSSNRVERKDEVG